MRKVSMGNLFLLLLIAVCLLSPVTAGGETVRYVAPAGRDAWSGRLPAPNAAKTDGPFATLERARDAIRQMKSSGGLAAPVRVLVRGGTYRLQKPFRLEAEDSGTPECPMTYAAFPGEKPLLTGGRLLRGWKPWRDGIWSCSLKEQGLAGLRFRQLFYRGVRQTIARYPNRDPQQPRRGGFLYAASGPQRDPAREIRFERNTFPRPWAHPTEVEVVFYGSYGWWTPRIPIASVEPSRGLLALSQPVPLNKIGSGDRYFVQHALEELDAPGEWYLDARSETVFFKPPDGKLAELGAVVPGLRNLVLFQGRLDSSRFVEYVNFSRFGLECCEDHGVVTEAIRHSEVSACTILQVGNAGIYLGPGSSYCRVVGNDIAWPGGHAIATYPSDVVTSKACHDIVISNNYAHHCGEIWHNSVGWGTGIYASGNAHVISHNLVHDTPYTAIAFCAGYDNIVEFNHVHHANMNAWDGDGIYGEPAVRGGAGRNIIRFNRVHDVVGYGRDGQGGWRSDVYSLGIRADNYLCETTIVGNLVYRCSLAGIQLNSGWNNTIENNIAVDNGEGQIGFSNMSRHGNKTPSALPEVLKRAPGKGPGAMTGTIIRRNILSAAAEGFIYYNKVGWAGDMLAEVDRNLIWQQGRMPRVNVMTMPSDEGSWAAWASGPRDRNSIVADPLFMNAAGDDYRLRPESPAFTFGFKPLPLERMGPYQDPLRASWPIIPPGP